MFGRKTLFTATLAALVPVALLAQSPPDRGPAGRGDGLLERWDRNGDGTVTRDEAQQAASDQAARLFDSIDLNKDGVTNADEARDARQARRDAMRAKAEERFKAADTNGDGSLSREEAEKSMPRLARRFERLDANKDGLLSPDELRHAAQHRRRHG